MIYLVLVIFAAVRIRKLLKFSSEWRHAKIFYFLIILQAVLRTTLFFVLSFEDNGQDSIDIGLFVLISIPDSLFIVTYFMLFWQLLSVFYYAHLNSQRRSGFLAAVSRKPTESLFSLVFLMVILTWLGTQIGLYLALTITEGSAVSVDDIWSEIGAVNLGMPTIVLISMLSLQLVYSGHPLRDASWQRKLRKMIIATIIWSLGRYFDGIMSVTYVDITKTINDMSDSGTDVTSALLLIIYLIVCEGICLFLVLDYSFMEIFMYSDTEQEITANRQEQRPIQELNSLEESKEALLEADFPSITPLTLLNIGDLQVIENLPGRKAGLGTLSKGELNGQVVFCRIVELPRISNYVQEELTEELGILKRLQIPYMVPYHGVVIDHSTVTIVTPWFSEGSLYRFLHSSSHTLTERERLKIALQVATCLSALHALGRTHGHLSSHNILLTPSRAAYVSEVGLIKFKKYAALVSNYTCKTAWTSPELLQEKGATPTKAQGSDDVYSFGIVLWELLTRQEPFPGNTRAQLLTQIVENGLRPEIPLTVPSKLAQILKSCWNREATTRPTFQLIIPTIETILEQK
jgi:hypothetical protein